MSTGAKCAYNISIMFVKWRVYIELENKDATNFLTMMTSWHVGKLWKEWEEKSQWEESVEKEKILHNSDI